MSNKSSDFAVVLQAAIETGLPAAGIAAYIRGHMDCLDIVINITKLPDTEVNKAMMMFNSELEFAMEKVLAILDKQRRKDELDLSKMNPISTEVH